MAEKYELAEKDYRAGMKYKDIAAKYDVSLNTVKSWKQRKWSNKDEDATKKGVHTKQKRVHTKKEVESTKAKGNRSGNPNPTSKFPKRNSLQTKHGLFSKFLHEEQIEIIQVMEGLNIADQIWLQIEIKFSAIIRMQKIMWVEDSEDHLKELSGESTSEFGGSETYKVSFAYERFESYIKAQTRAMAEYRNLVKQFCEMAHDEDERRLKLEQMQLNIDKSKAEIKQLTNETESSSRTIIVNDKEEMRRLMNERASR